MPTIAMGSGLGTVGEKVNEGVIGGGNAAGWGCL